MVVLSRKCTRHVQGYCHVVLCVPQLLIRTSRARIESTESFESESVPEAVPERASLGGRLLCLRLFLGHHESHDVVCRMTDD
jgi:hypothetical protein